MRCRIAEKTEAKYYDRRRLQKNIVDFIKEIAPDFERSSIITELELNNQDYSLPDIKGMYENGIGAWDSSLVGGIVLNALHVCLIGYSVLMRLGIGQNEYIEWAKLQSTVNVYIIECVVEIIDKAWTMIVPTDEVTVLFLFRHNAAVTEKCLQTLR